MSSSTSRGASLLPIFLLSAAGFTVLTTEFIIVGLLPAMARDLQVSVPTAGLLVTLFAFTVAAVGPPLTAIMGRFERKQLFVATLLLFAVSNLLAATASNFAVMAFARFIPALALPVFWALASETAVEIMGPERAGKAISMVSFGVVAATIFGIPIGTLVADAFGWRVAFGSLAVLALAKAVLLMRFLPIMRIEKEAIPVMAQMGILRDRFVAGNVLLSLLVFAGMFTSYTYLADILEKIGKFDGATIGWILMGFGTMGLIGNWLGGKLVDRSALGASVFFCVPIALAMVALVPALHSYLLTGLILAVWGTGQAGLFTAAHVRVMKSASANPGLGASLNISGANMGIGLGAVVGGRVIDAYGLGWVGWAAAGVLALSVGLALLMMVSPKKESGLVPCMDCDS
ncbi:MFS transporter [Luteolibacter sp. GHJ8]|uniref:MFS transporter n=1 Tax=Luteolibacter rhizosphaerae TaxID=2989719 RepID=A0ABT3FZ13_9BACT|nr:MFS transporter [Luteolibacter rhizosphaerae]MCW1912818.1 MFS transporter [Luteolibacter rhizosphaerae]